MEHGVDYSDFVNVHTQQKKEMGILLAVGIEKPAVILQYTIETLLIAVAAFPPCPSVRASRLQECLALIIPAKDSRECNRHNTAFYFFGGDFRSYPVDYCGIGILHPLLCD